MGIPQVIAVIMFAVNILFMKKEIMARVNTVIAVIVWVAMLACAMIATFFAEGNVFELIVTECIWTFLVYIGIGTGIELLKK